MGIGVTAGIDYLLGVLALSTGGQASGQLMLTTDPSKWNEGKLAEAGITGTGGIFASVGLPIDAPGAQGVVGAPEQDSPTSAVGASAGAAAGIVLTTANSISDFAGPANTFNLDLPAISFSFSSSPSAKSLSITFGLSGVLGYSMYKTNTGVLASTGGK